MSTRRVLLLAGAGASFLLSCCSGLGGMISLLAEHPDPKTGHIVGAEESPKIFAGGVGIALALGGLGAYLVFLAARKQGPKPP